jgi:hypothetical protein
MAVALSAGLDASGQAVLWLPKDRIMLFNDYPKGFVDPSAINPEQSYYRVGTPGWWHDSAPAPGSGFNIAPRALLAGTNHTFTSVTDGVRTSVWTFTDCRMGSPYWMPGARTIAPTSGYNSSIQTNWMAILRNTDASMIVTPFYPEGIGTLYFDAINVFVEYPNQVVVEIATNMWDSINAGRTSTLDEHETATLTYIWDPVSTTELNQTDATPVRGQHVFNYRGAARIRLWKVSKHDGPADERFVAIDNIRLSFPPSDVVLSRPEIVCNPGYPSAGVNFFVRCLADNIGTNAYERTWANGGSSSGRDVRLFYRWRYLDQASNAWASVAMAHVPGTGDGFGNREIWQGQVPVQPRVGDLEYYYQTTFSGYRYSTRDYTLLGYTGYWPGASESSELIGERTFRGGASQTDGREFYTRLRPYSSPFGSVSVVTGPVLQENPIPMVLVSNNLWRGMVPVNNGGITNLSFFFRAEREYRPGDASFATNALYWSSDSSGSAAGGLVPFSGTCHPYSSKPDRRLQVTAAGGGYVQVLLDLSDTNAPSYIAVRAEYQNFNQWAAPADVFTDSNGQASKQSFPNTFDSWAADGAYSYDEYFRGSPAATNVFVREPAATFNGWLAGSVAYAVERTEADPLNSHLPGNNTVRNVALRLKGGSDGLGLGYVHNAQLSLPDGIDRIDFKCRLGQRSSPYEATTYKLGYTNQNYCVRAATGADAGVSPEAPSVSLIGYMNDPDNFYEYRVTQIPHLANLDLDQRVSLQLFKWKAGVPYLVATNTTLFDSNVKLTGGFTLEMRFFNRSPARTYIGCGITTLNSGNPLIAYDDQGTGISGAAIQSGTFGFTSTECRARVNAVRTLATVWNSSANRADPSGSETYWLRQDAAGFTVDLANWYTPAGRFEGRSDYSTPGIYAAIPTQKLGIYLQPTVFRTSDAPEAPGTLAWHLAKEITLTGFGYAVTNVPIYAWRSQFVMMQVMGRTDNLQVDVIVDELSLSGWRGQTSSDLTLDDGDEDPLNDPIENVARDNEWVASEAWIVAVTNAGLNEGRIADSFSRTLRSPMTSVQLSTRFANTDDGWVTNSTYVYNGWIFLNGLDKTNLFAVNFADSVLLKIGNSETTILRATNADPTIVTNVASRGWYPFELRLGYGTGAVVGPAGGGHFGGLGVAYSRDKGATWVPIRDPGDGTFLQTEVKTVQLDHSRGGRTINGGTEGDWLDQAVRAPQLVDNAGMLEFDYRVVRAPAKLSMQFSRDRVSWTEFDSVSTNVAMPAFTHKIAYLGTNVTGYLRVVNVREGIYTNAFVEIDNAIAWDDPFVSDTDWRSYNVKITDSDPQRVLLDETKGCFLNNSQYADTKPSQILYTDAFVVSPMLPTGLGSLTFMARAYSNNQSAALSVLATTHPDGPRAPNGAWDTLTNIQFAAASPALYATYAVTPSDGRFYRAVKVVTPTSGGGTRACVEELAIVEPVFPGLMIGEVTVLCASAGGGFDERHQPLHSDEVGFRVQLVNVQRDPRDIKVFLDYYVGTNAWGAAHWPVTNTLVMTAIDSHYNFQTDIFNLIPFQEKNQVVQYRVRVEYKDAEWHTFEVLQTEFTNPSWYYPVDLNKTFAATGGWSPYYIVYDIPVGAVWINEINAYEEWDGLTHHFGENKYVEIAVPAEVSLAGWMVDLVRASRSSVTYTLPADLPEQVAVTNGYAFFVIGHDLDTRPNKNAVPALPKLDYGILSFSSNLEAGSPGGIRLRRPWGMYEHVVAYDVYHTWAPGDEWAAEDPQGQFQYVGQDYIGGSLNVVSNSVRYAMPQPSDWVFPLEWTPGGPNVGQVVEDANLLAPGISNIVVRSSMSPMLGTQNGKTENPYSFKLGIGSSTNILYAATNWYRLTSIRLNGVEQLTAGEVPSYNLVLSNVQSNQNIQVALRLRQDVGGLDLDSDILQWLTGFGDGTFAPTWYGRTPHVDDEQRRELAIVERYWVNANPMVTNYLRGGVVGVVREASTTNFFITVALDLNGTNVTHLMGGNVPGNAAVFKIEARQPPAVTEWTMLQQFRFDAQSFNSSHLATALILNPFHRFSDVFKETNADKPLALRWVLEYEDARFSIPILMSTNAPGTGP